MMCDSLSPSLRPRIGHFQAALLWVWASFAASAQPSLKPLYKHWEMVAKSNLVARVRLRVPLSEMRASVAAHQRYARVQLRMDVQEPVKGHFPPPDLTVRFETGASAHHPSAAFVEEIDGQEVIIFLRVWTGGASFTDEGPDAVLPFSADAFSQIEAEVKNQAEIVEHFDDLPAGQAQSGDVNVRKLFDALTIKSTQEAAWGQLLRLSRRDAPAVVRLLKDQRRIPAFAAPIPNQAPDAFEEFRQLGASSVHEAASNILEHLTGMSFEDEGWRVWSVYESGAI